MKFSKETWMGGLREKYQNDVLHGIMNNIAPLPSASTLKTNIAKENVSPDLSLKKIVEKRNYLLKEIRHYDLLSENHQRISWALDFFKHFLILVSFVSGFVSISVFPSLVGVQVDSSSSVVGLKVCVITTVIKKYKSIIKKKRKKHKKIVSRAKAELNAIAVLFSKGDSYINHEEYLLVNNVTTIQ